MAGMATREDLGCNWRAAALMPGLSNGRPATMEALNEELAWIYHNYAQQLGDGACAEERDIVRMREGRRGFLPCRSAEALKADAFLARRRTR